MMTKAMFRVVLTCHVYRQCSGTRSIVSSNWGCASQAFPTREACCCIAGLRFATVPNLENVSLCCQHYEKNHLQGADGDGGRTFQLEFGNGVAGLLYKWHKLV